MASDSTQEDLATKVAGDIFNQQKAYYADLLQLPELPTSAWDIMNASKGKYDLNKALSIADQNRMLNQQKALAEEAALNKMLETSKEAGYIVDTEKGKIAEVKETIIPWSAWKGYQEWQKNVNNMLKLLDRSNERQDKAARAVLYLMSQSAGQRLGNKPINDWQKRLLTSQSSGVVL